MIKIYSDGSCDNRDGKKMGGYAAIIIGDDENAAPVVIEGREKTTTSNRMEMTAALVALASLEPGTQVEVYTDSQYLKLGVEHYMWKWMDNGWKTSSNKPVKNQDLWIALYYAIQALHVEFKWIKGHSGHPLNELADRTAKKAAGYKY